MKLFASCWLITIATSTLCFADITRLPTEQRLALSHASQFHELHAVAELPRSIFKLCADDKGRLAEPGQKWQPTDVASDDSLARKRLIWAATNGDYYVVHYESGGIAHGYHVLVAKLQRNEQAPTFWWHAIGKPLKDFSAFSGAIANNKLDDALNYPR